MKVATVTGLVAGLAITAGAQPLDGPVVTGCNGDNFQGDCWEIQVENGLCKTLPAEANDKINSIATGDLYCKAFEHSDCTGDNIAVGDPVSLPYHYRNKMSSVQCWESTSNPRRSNIARRSRTARTKRSAAEWQKRTTKGQTDAEESDVGIRAYSGGEAMVKPLGQTRPENRGRAWKRDLSTFGNSDALILKRSPSPPSAVVKLINVVSGESRPKTDGAGLRDVAEAWRKLGGKSKRSLARRNPAPESSDSDSDSDGGVWIGHDSPSDSDGGVRIGRPFGRLFGSADGDSGYESMKRRSIPSVIVDTDTPHISMPTPKIGIPIHVPDLPYVNTPVVKDGIVIEPGLTAEQQAEINEHIAWQAVNAQKRAEKRAERAQAWGLNPYGRLGKIGTTVL